MCLVIYLSTSIYSW